MKVHIVGARSYLAGVLETHLRDAFPVRRVAAKDFGAGDISAGDVSAGDVIINCAWEPSLYEEKVGKELSWDGAFAAIARDRGARLVMLSTRAVYPNRVEPALREDEPTAPQSTYGKNKVRVETGLAEILGPRLLVVRMGNVFGEEPPGRRTFISTAINTLDTRQEIELRMAARTRKDFLPAGYLGKAIRELVRAETHGIYNVSSGLALPVSEVAGALIRGYGAGEIRVSNEAVGEEFRLDTTKLRECTGLSITDRELLEALEKTARDHRQ